MIKITLFLLLTAYIIAEFYLTTPHDLSCGTKPVKTVLRRNGIHALAMVVAVVPVFNIKLLWCALMIVLAHLIVDLAMCFLWHKTNESSLPRLILHVGILLATAAMLSRFNVTIDWLPVIGRYAEPFRNTILAGLTWVLTLLAIGKPMDFIIGDVLAPFKLKIDDETESNPNAETLIGTLERAIVLLLLLVGQYIVIGFLLAVKTAVRWRDIARKERKAADYYLLNTFFSLLSVMAWYFLIF